MPYITKERVSEIRNEIKKQYPAANGWKFSITRENCSSVHVEILTAPINMLEGSERAEKGYETVNPYFIHSHYEKQPAVREVLQNLKDIMNDGNRIVSEDGDYGSIPAFYINLRIGKWDRPFVLSDVKPEPVGQVAPVSTEVVESGTVQIIEYSDRAIAVIGDTKPIKEKLKELGGRFNARLTCGAGWIFRKIDLEKVQTALSA